MPAEYISETLNSYFAVFLHHFTGHMMVTCFTDILKQKTVFMPNRLPFLNVLSLIQFQ